MATTKLSGETNVKVRNESIEQIRADIMRPLPRPTISFILTMVVIVVVFSWSISATEANPQRIVAGFPALLRFVGGLLPPEFEFSDGSERVINLSEFSIEPISPAAKATRAQRASEEDIANMTEGQRVLYTLQVADQDPIQIISAEEAANYNRDEVELLRPYIVDAGMTIVLDDWDEAVIIVAEGQRSVNAVPYRDGQVVVARRYVLEQGDILIGYPVIITAIIETIQIAIIGTLGGILLALPFSLLAARNISPHPLVYQLTRLFLNLSRSIPTLIWALVMVSAVGLGPFAGIMAVIVASVGSTARLYADSFEQIDPNQVAAIRATGAGSLRVFNYSVLPQAFPLLATYSLISFEVNVRDSTILGIVGAGGVGFILQKYAALFQFQRLMGAVIIIAIMVTIIDRLSDYIRKRII